MAKIIKILNYELYVDDPSVDEFERVCQILSQKTDPRSLSPQELPVGPGKVLSSNMRRAKECLDIKPETEIDYRDDLRELAFDLSKFCSREDYTSHKSDAVREAFVKAFVSDQLELPRSEIQKQIEGLLKEVQETDATIISHTFRMKLIEIYLEIGEDLFKEPELLAEHLDTKKKIYEFGHSFNLG